MEELLTKDGIAFIVNRVLDNAKDAIKDYEDKPSDYNAGIKFAYYEILDTIKNELEIHGEDVKKYGLDFQLESIA
jgi:hypothetical protein